MLTRKHKTKRWEVSIIILEGEPFKKFKVTRRLPELNVAETRIFQNKKKARKQFREWLK